MRTIARLPRPAVLALAFAAVLAPRPAAAQYGESITVERILIDVRVTDASGEPILGLEAGDFTVTLAGKKAPVESAVWIDDIEGLAIPAAPEAAEPQDRPAAPAGRLFIVFVQTDFARASTRVQGQLAFLRYATKLVESFEPEDRVAVFSFDSHLKFRLDFTADKEKVNEAIRDTIRIDDPPAPPIVPNPAMASRLDREAMRRASTSEAGLRIVGDALRPIPGAKTLLLLGWGLGELAGNGVRMKSAWPAARHALDAARVSIFALDTTNADYHDLQIGLRSAAEQTGGFYAKTHLFPQIAVDRVRRTLAGRYELELRRPEGLTPGTHPVDVRVPVRGAVVLAPSTWMDRAQ